METILGAIGLVLVALYLLLLRWARESRARWEAEHLRQCAGCGRVLYHR